MPATRLGWLFALSFATAVPCQRGDFPKDADAQLLLDLGNEERSADAVHVLTGRGAAAIANLTAAIRDPAFRADAGRLATAFYVLGRLGDAAAGAAPLLLDEMKDARGHVRRNLYWALGEIGPKAEALGHRVLQRLGEAEPGVRDHLEWSVACRRVALGLHPRASELRELLLRREDRVSLTAVAAYLCRLTPGTEVPRPELLTAWNRADYDSKRYRDSHERERAALQLAHAVVLHADDAFEAESARAALIDHFDVDVRLQAVMQIGQQPGVYPAPAVRALQRALADDSVRVRREVVTSLGMIGPRAEDALPLLATLKGDQDDQIRVRAGSAARAIIAR